MTRKMPAILVLAGALALGACGTTPGERALSGGLIGAGTGAAIGSFSGNAGAGALIGGAVGAVGGAVTSPNTVYMGEPAWR